MGVVGYTIDCINHRIAGQNLQFQKGRVHGGLVIAKGYLGIDAFFWAISPCFNATLVNFAGSAINDYKMRKK